MTPLMLWMAVAAVALVSTALWAIAARETGVYVTSGLSFVTWSWLSLTGGDTAMIIETGESIWMRESLASIQLVAIALAVISLVVFALRLMGAYPSPTNNAAETESEQPRSAQQ